MADTSQFDNKPYKGHLSYQQEDAAIFFGRTREADQLIAKILASPFTLVHAQSGAGKTSLLNARIIPGLEERGWTAVLARPHFDPSLSLRTGALNQVIPPPVAEGIALGNANAALLPGTDISLRQVLDQFALFEACDAGRRALLQPLSLSGLPETFRPLFFRLLQCTLEVAQFGEHLEVLLYPAGGGEGGAALDPRVSAAALAGMLMRPELLAAHTDLTTRIAREGQTLTSFVESLYGLYGRRRTQFRLVLIMDQFEEIFTRFTANPQPGEQGGRPTWKLRMSFFEELRELYQKKFSFPVHIVLSMRDEYIAELDPIRRFVRDLDSISYHLTFLEKDEAQLAIGEPARLFGYDYGPEVYDDIFGALLREDRFVEPSQLQIVCEKLWTVAGEALAHRSVGDDKTISLISLAELPEGGARRILKNFFTEYLNQLDAEDTTGMSRLEALEVLDQLVVAESGTRNIVERKVLEHAPFRDPRHRARVVESLAAKRIIRVEQRLGGDFAEVTHEFLIPSIQDHIAAELNGANEYANLRWALRAVVRFKDVDFRDGASNLLPRPVCLIVDSNRERLFYGDSPVERILPELMLRSALLLGAERDSLKYWMDKFAELGVEKALDEILGEARINDPGRRSMSLYELAIVTQQARAVPVTAAQAIFVLRAQVERAPDSDREGIVFWARLARENAAKSLSDR